MRDNKCQMLSKGKQMGYENIYELMGYQILKYFRMSSTHIFEDDIFGGGGGINDA